VIIKSPTKAKEKNDGVRGELGLSCFCAFLILNLYTGHFVFLSSFSHLSIQIAIVLKMRRQYRVPA
jgi:hypothetical protein